MTETTTIGHGRRIAAGSQRLEYRSRKPSKRSLNQRITGQGRQVDFIDQRPASTGVTVNETKSEVSVATETTMPNSASCTPTAPLANAIGKKTTTSTIVMTIAAWPISLRPLSAASAGASPRS